MSTVDEIKVEHRAELAAILDPRSPADAMAAYFALEHPADRVRIYAAKSNASLIVGFLIKARTGYDLFQPLLVPFTASGQDLNNLLELALFDTPQALISLPNEQVDQLEAHFQLRQPRLAELLRLDPRHFRQIINVLILAEDTPDGWPRFEVRRGENTFAAAGVNWLGKRYAEVYLDQLSDLAQDFAPSLLSAISGRLLEDRRIALLRVGEGESQLHSAAEEVGFRPTGAKTVLGTIRK